jgi:hypothetical protein
VTDLHPLLVEIVEQRQRVEDLRDRYDGRVRAETRRLAELIAATRDAEDAGVHPTAAARAMGVTKGYAFELMKKLDAGDLD